MINALILFYLNFCWTEEIMTDLQQVLKGKTPVSVLQEICSKRKLTPTYNILANEGPVHEPVFVMRAQAGDFQGMFYLNRLTMRNNTYLVNWQKIDS